MKISELEQYELLEEREIKDLNSTGYILKHKKSGAKLMLLSNEDENKVFTIGFRTPPNDSTGVPHILEHSVLCGSKKFPAKDPFIELAKGSLNTFLNAMTYPDKTVYPVASCNEKDFQNLMDVYMDAVLHPNIYKREEIFKQEGWHYELENKEDPVEISGVVYSEMKGAFSSPEGTLDREILNSLFPDTTYVNESGGDPDVIPELTYEAFLDFHKKYYHPVNSYIYLYGDMDMVEKLLWLDEEYLSKYEAIEIDSTIHTQKSFDKPVELIKEYSISSDEKEEENTYLSYNKVISTSLDRETCIAFQILEYALMAPGAPLKQALIDAGIGKDITSSYENSIIQPYFSIIAKNSEVDKKDEFIKIIEDVLKDQVKNKLNKKSLLAGINVFEFKYREADFGSYPKGLMYGLQSFDSWLYDDNSPFLHLECNSVFEDLRQKIDTGYFEDLIQKYLLDNNHGSIVIFKPKRGLTALKDEALKKKLDDYKSSLTDEEIEKLITDTKALKIYQTEPSTKEELETIPILKREDIRKTVTPYHNTEVDIDGVKVVHHNFFTNGIGYLSLCFKMDKIDNKLLPYLGILKSVLGSIDTTKHTYLELTNEINTNSGGVTPYFSSFSRVDNPKEFDLYFFFKARVLYNKIDFVFDIVKEIISCSKLNDYKRLKEIIAENRSRLQMVINSAGHSIALVRCLSYSSQKAKFADITNGLEFYDFLTDLDENFDKHKEELVTALETLVKSIFRPENMIISYAANDEGFKYINKPLADFSKFLYTDEINNDVLNIQCEKKNEGFKTAAKVQYVCRSGNYYDAGYKYNGALLVLKTILGYDYLWNNVRVKGGAYGCMSDFQHNGDTYFVSYRDPRLKETIDVYENMPEYIRNFEADERDMTKYIIGTCSSIDTPLTPNTRASRSLGAYLTGRTIEENQKHRDSILNASVEDIRALADYVEAVLSQGNLCAVGGEDKIEDNKELFMNVKSIH